MSIQDNKPIISALEDDEVVVVPTLKYVKDSIENHAQSRNHPYATLVDKGFVTLSNDVDNDSEMTAATSKAVKKAYDLANAANVNADTRLTKDQNGADIPNKEVFVKNIGAVSITGGIYPGSFQFQQVETTPKESNPVMLVSAPHQQSNKLVAFTSYGWYDNSIHTGIVRGGSTDTLGYAIELNGRRTFAVDKWGLTINPDFQWGGINMYRPSGTYWRIEGNPGSASTLLNFIDRNSDGSNIFVQSLPTGNGSIMSTSHHYVDANGFVRKISPVIKLYTDGKFETNNESKGVTAERLSKGVYLIKGIIRSGANDIWDSTENGIEIPLCKNKLPLIWMDHEILPDGSIKLMIYHREHPDAPPFARNTKEGYADGDLIDVPEGRFISVRVQMPAIQDEKPQA
ncbi:hypothetical protein (Similarities with unknown protein from a prophage) [Xenorhabdus nematophila ATCC 19061]|uniref:Phage tail protein C-terminal domain-containing protein n=1 Tax=Xenorhabdus nematophila (strain ATCC 19061 / DSM 3370 / CCUG 14189 / LMG 1036 / NCIMB 9965 / AN6) TaxID=406817 RepID=D3VES4_XENNA|nr:phage tail protein [Xenorhabdus nematophila]CBJ90186.1 hypothetical protein (Similarities with unknown protein from a prophage) [Xenorhabdus nematophila ATCC 19061]CEE91754.1 hypothetical protein (Similarities with unknown protein from a prophage) [Xenorhabdus nematophila str. Anatoliense]CEE95991.1 hypothetical protein (Similarities with unknown protein from a prophage) [Xenorhabdus nematophila str. Anatoliense]CEK23049.1 hypothetical protein (Similarities with unknown protein from a propha